MVPKFSLSTRGLALTALLSFGFHLMAPGLSLWAQPFRTFEESRPDLERFAGRARRLQSEAAFTNYLELGLRAELEEWDAVAADVLNERSEQIESDESLDEAEKAAQQAALEASYLAARLSWENQAEQLLQEERGVFRAEQVALEQPEMDPQQYDDIAARIEAEFAIEAEFSPEQFQSRFIQEESGLRENFEEELSARVDQARTSVGALSPAERAAFEARLDQRAAEIRSEFEIQDHFYALRASNRYVALRRADDVSLRLFAESEAAEAIGADILEETLEQIEAETTPLLEEAQQELEAAEPASASIDDLTGSWQEKMESVIDAGLDRFSRAEEELYRSRLEWAADENRSREEAERIWKENHERLKTARDEWFQSLQEEITEGRALWQSKFNEFQQARADAQTRLENYILEERERREATLAQIGDLVRGGGAALGEAKAAYQYYDDLLAGLASSGLKTDRDRTLYEFYGQQRDIMRESMLRFQTLLAGAEGTLEANMHSDDASTGFLTDRRVFAGDLPERTAALDEEEYRTDLLELIASESEDFVLYRRDLEALIDENDLFSERRAELSESSSFAPESVGSVAELEALVRGLPDYNESQRRELLEMIAGRNDVSDPAERLAAIVSDIGAWQDETPNARLKRRVGEYFESGLSGYFASQNENDPYLLTSAEYEWELLRRERNYFARRLERARAVQQYANLAERHDARTEVVSLTAARAEAARIHHSLLELNYGVLSGEVAVAAEARNDAAVRDAELERLLLEADIDLSVIGGRLDGFAAEQELLEELAGLGSDPGAEGIVQLGEELDAFLLTFVSEEKRPEHRVAALIDRLLEINQARASGDEAALAARLGNLRLLASDLSGEVGQLRALYEEGDDSIAEQVDALRNTLAERAVPDYQNELSNIRTELEANAALLATAKLRLDEAGERYREARIDFDILRSEHSGELVRLDLENATRSLSGILNRMQALSELDGFEAGVLFPGEHADPVFAARASYLYEISERTRATSDLAGLQSGLAQIRAFEAAKRRRAGFESLVPDAGPLSERLAALCAHREVLLGNPADPSEERAGAIVNELFARIESLGARLEHAREREADLTAGESARLQAEDEARALERELERRLSNFESALRGEQSQRRQLLDQTLSPDQAVSIEELAERLSAAYESTTERARTIAGLANARLHTLLEEHPDKDTEALLGLLRSELANLPASLAASDPLLESEPGASDAVLSLELARQWVVLHREEIDASRTAPATEFDPRSAAERRNDVLFAIEADGLEANEAALFQAGLEENAAGAAFQNRFRTTRESLIGAIDGLLSMPAADQGEALRSLAPGTREQLRALAGIDATALFLNDDLIAGRTLLLAELRRLESGGERELYRSQVARESQSELQSLSLQVLVLQSALQSSRRERARLDRRRALLENAIVLETDPDARDALENELALLEASLVDLQSQIEAQSESLHELGRALARASGTLAAATGNPNDGGALFAGALNLLGREQIGLSLLESTLEATGRAEESGPVRNASGAFDRTATTANERLRAVIGFFESDAAGRILRSADGEPIISAEFQALGIDDPEVDLISVLGGSRSGADLERWARRLTAWLEDDARRAAADPEMVAAMELLHEPLSELAAARRLIEERDRPAAELQAEASAALLRLDALSGKLTAWFGFQDQMSAALSEARARAARGEQAGAGTLLRALFEDPDNAAFFHLMSGYSLDGTADAYEHPEAARRVAGLTTLYRRLNETRLAAAIGTIASDYEAQLEDALAFENHAIEPGQFLRERPELQAGDLRDFIAGLNPDHTDLRAAVWQRIQTLSPARGLFAGALIETLHTVDGNGVALQDALLLALQNTETELRTGLGVLLDAEVEAYTYEADFVIDDGISEALSTHSARVAAGRDRLLQAMTEFSAAEDLETLVELVFVELDAAETPESLRLKVSALLSQSESPGSAVQELADYLGALEPPTPAELGALRTQLSHRELNRAFDIVAVLDDYEPDLIPTELREFVLLSQYEAGRERLDAFLADRASDEESVRQNAFLDLSGLPGFVARAVLAEDIDLFFQEEPIAGRIAGHASLSTDDLISLYLEDRNTDATGIADQVTFLRERLQHLEYARLSSDAAGSIHTLHAADYTRDFSNFLFLTKLDDFLKREALSLDGADISERRASFASAFEAFLSDPAYASDGETLQQQLAFDSERDRLFALAFAHLEFGTELDDYLPAALRELSAAEREAGPATADENLPETLRNLLADGQTAEAALADLTPDCRRAARERSFERVLLAAIESGAASPRLTDSASGFLLEDSDLENLLASADLEAVSPGERAELRAMGEQMLRTLYAPAADSESALVRALREDRLLSQFLAGPSDQLQLAVFMDTEQERWPRILESYHAALGGAASELAALDRQDRGALLEAALASAAGQPNALRSSLSPQEQGALHQFAEDFLNRLSQPERQALVENSTEYELLFSIEADRERLTSGLIEDLEAHVNATLNAQASDALRALVQENQSALLGAFIERFQIQNGQRAALSVRSQALFETGGDALRELVDETIAQIDGPLAGLLREEHLFLTRFVDQLLEVDAERNALRATLYGDELINAGGPVLGAATGRALNIAALNRAGIEQSLVVALEQSAQFFSNLGQTLLEERAEARALQQFARDRGDDSPAGNRFAHYRTYLGSERLSQEAAFERFQEQNPDSALGFAEFQGGAVLEANSLEIDVSTLFLDPEWEARLLSDAFDPDSETRLELGAETADPSDDQSLSLRRLNTVSSRSMREAVGGGDAELRYTYIESLANNYIEAGSRLNAALNAVFVAAGLADERAANSAGESEITEAILADYNPDANPDGDADLSALLELESDAGTRLALHSEGRLDEASRAISSGLSEIDQAGSDFADAGRRDQLRTLNAVQFLDTVYRAAADEMEAAQSVVQGFASTGEELEEQFADRNREYVEALNRSALSYRKLEAARSEFETSVAVRDYAATPYIQAGGDSEDPDHAADARAEFERAFAALELAQSRLEDQALAVLSQDRLEDFAAVAEAMGAGESFSALNPTERERLQELRALQLPGAAGLDAEQQSELQELTRRDVAERYGEYIAARSDHIEETMRLVRLSKASEIVSGEIDRLRALSEIKKRDFESELARRLGGFGEDAELTRARDSVYMRLAAQVEGGASSLYGEFHAWYWGSGAWAGPFGNAALQSPPQITPGQVTEAGLGAVGAALIPGGDAGAIGQWMAGGGRLAEYDGFGGVYTGYLMSIGQRDLAALNNIITRSIMIPLMATGAALIATANGLLTIPLVGPAMAQPLFASGYASIAHAQTAMASAQAQFLVAQNIMIFGAIASLQSAGTYSVEKVMGRQREYEEARARLEYFTKAPDLATLKQRVIAFGAEHTDNDSANALYALSDEDLLYLFGRDAEENPVFVRSDGGENEVDDRERADGLDVSTLEERTEFRDAYGRRYDPDSLQFVQPAPLIDGSYGGFTRIRVALASGATVYGFARLIEEGAPEHEIFDAGEVLRVAVDHETELRNERRDRYYALGDQLGGSDPAFIYDERDRTFAELFRLAGDQAEGGREFAGYRITYEEYERNQADIFAAELEQRRQKQLAGWALREQELQDRFTEWEERFGSIGERGRLAWAGAEHEFLQKWRDEEREAERAREAAELDWENKVREQAGARVAWENNVRAAASEATIREVLGSAIDELNAQLLQSQNNLGISISRIDRTAAIESAIAESQNNHPSSIENLSKINQSIKDFQTRLAVSELAGASGLLESAALSSGYRNELKKHAGNMRVQANVQVFEEYRRLLENLEFQVEVQNEAIANQTRAAALGRGFVDAGGVFARESGLSSFRAYVNPYVWFDAESRVAGELDRFGFSPLTGSDLTNFLSDRSNAEVDAFFHTQKLAVQAVFESILGTGSGEERSRSRDERVIGSFGTWAGRQPGGSDYQAVENFNYAAPNNAILNNPGAMDALQFGTFGGFGELGEMGIRPGGAALGFYPQLELASRMLAQNDTNNLNHLAGAEDPITTTINQWNIATLTANSFLNVERATRVNGKSAGYMWEAQILSSVKQPMVAAGSALLAAGIAGSWTGLGALLIPLGMALNAVGNSINVNPTSGERSVKMDDRAAISTAVATVGAFAGGALSGLGEFYGASASTIGALSAAGSGTANVIGAGFQYDNRGRS
ncbi:MAG: hypothetical protein KDK35_19375, partial [Leptospiraceae bacterium]|nr:hypothetical protein [Leptospiraceae bacterium]